MQYQPLGGYRLCAMTDHRFTRTALHHGDAEMPRDDQAFHLRSGSVISRGPWEPPHPFANGQDSADRSNGSPPVVLDGQLCGLFAIDIVGFNGRQRDDDIQIYVHTSLYTIVQAAFDRSDIAWSACAHEDRGDGILIVVPPTIPAGRLADTIPDRLRELIRVHNRVSCEAARIQVRTAAHIGPVHHDGHGFVGHSLCLLYRLLDARSFRRILSASSAEVAFIISDYMYENVTRRHSSIMDPALFQRLLVRAKETKTRAWVYVPGQLPGDTFVLRILMHVKARGRRAGSSPLMQRATGPQDRVEVDARLRPRWFRQQEHGKYLGKVLGPQDRQQRGRVTTHR
jgi:hypothetical protein